MDSINLPALNIQGISGGGVGAEGRSAIPSSATSAIQGKREAFVIRQVTRIILICCVATWGLWGEMDSSLAQQLGTPRRVKISFTSMPSKALFNFVLEGQKVSGKTPSTKSFTLRDGTEVKVTFSQKGYKDCEKKFLVHWPQNGTEGTLVIDTEEQIMSSSSGAKPPEVGCELTKVEDISH